LYSGLYYKNILTIVSDDRKWSLYYSTGFIYDRHLWSSKYFYNTGHRSQSYKYFLLCKL